MDRIYRKKEGQHYLHKMKVFSLYVDAKNLDFSWFYSSSFSFIEHLIGQFLKFFYIISSFNSFYIKRGFLSLGGHDLEYVLKRMVVFPGDCEK